MTCTYLVNREHPLAPDFIPQFLVQADIPFHLCEPRSRRMLCQPAAEAAHQLFCYSRTFHISLYGVSGYRPYDRQKEIYNSSLQSQGREHTERFIAAPGCSEHQTGLALDVSCPDVGFELTEKFEDTREGKWLQTYAPMYGFILRYPKNKEEITGYAYEPWHIRYVTKPLALYLSLTGLSLEEYHHI